MQALLEPYLQRMENLCGSFDERKDVMVVVRKKAEELVEKYDSEYLKRFDKLKQLLYETEKHVVSETRNVTVDITVRVTDINGYNYSTSESFSSNRVDLSEFNEIFESLEQKIKTSDKLLAAAEKFKVVSEQLKNAREKANNLLE
jgi:predicted RND superfamily exporter protein